MVVYLPLKEKHHVRTKRILIRFQRGLQEIFFFSSRRRHTRLQGDWSSDVCSSDLHYKSAPENLPEIGKQLGVAHILEGSVQMSGDGVRVNVQLIKVANDSHLWADTRSEERRVGKECRSRWSPYH